VYPCEISNFVIENGVREEEEEEEEEEEVEIGVVGHGWVAR
jgi:hypothetical protein